MIGTKLDKYEIVQKIGEGGMATVYEGTHQTLGRKVAIKVLHPHLSSAAKNRERFAREARTIERLEHSAILQIFDYSGPDADLSYIVTELIDGDTLKELTERVGLLPSELVAIVGLKISEALAYAHHAGIIHRDIKPENIMIRADGAVKVMDFGIARFLEESAITMTGSLIGSPAYMSPEQVLERTPDTRSDLFSLGALLFKLLTGQLAFPGTNPSVTLKKVIEGDHPRVLDLAPTADADLADLIEQLLSPDPSHRPSTAQEVADRLAAILDANEVDPERTQFSTLAFLRDPPIYESKLRSHHNETLLKRGKEALETNDHQKARAIFNRLLAINPEHPEVLDLLADVANQNDSLPRLQLVKRLAGVLALVGLAGAAWIAAHRSSADIDQDLPSVPSLVDVSNAPETAPPNEPPSQQGAPKQSEGAGSLSNGLGAQVPDAPSSSIATTNEDRATAVPSPRPSNSRPVEASEPEAAQPPVGSISSTPSPLETTEPLETTRTLVTVGLSRTQRGVWADVYIDGKSVGRTRGGGSPLEVEVSPGAHTLKITNDYALAFEQDFDAVPGEAIAIEDITLQKRPVRIQLSASIPADCVLVFKGRDLGTTGALGYQTSLAEASDADQLHIRCTDGTMMGPYSFPTATPGEVLRWPPTP